MSAMAIPPTAMTGATTSMVQPMSTSICTCWTSLVLRVMSEPAPKVETSRSENSLTRSKIFFRRSRPMPMAERAASQVARTERVPWVRLTATMRPPVRQM